MYSSNARILHNVVRFVSYAYDTNIAYRIVFNVVLAPLPYARPGGEPCTTFIFFVALAETLLNGAAPHLRTTYL